MVVSLQGSQSQNRNKKKNHVKRNKALYKPILVPLSKLYPLLIQNSLVTPRPLNPVLGPWHNANLTCEFHKGAEGHDLDTCLALGFVVQELIYDKDLIIEEDHPDVECRYRSGIMGHPVEECKGFELKLQSLLELMKPQEGKPNANVLIPESKDKGPMRPLKVLYHKEQVIIDEGVPLSGPGN